MNQIQQNQFVGVFEVQQKIGDRYRLYGMSGHDLRVTMDMCNEMVPDHRIVPAQGICLTVDDVLCPVCQGTDTIALAYGGVKCYTCFKNRTLVEKIWEKICLFLTLN